MASSDEDGEIMPDCVTNYHFVNYSNAPVPFSNLPLHFSDHDDQHSSSISRVFLLGSTDGGLRNVYKEVIAWKFELSYVVPQFYMLSKGKIWIKLEKPRKCYEVIIKNVLIAVHCLHFLKRNVDASRDALRSYLMKASSLCDVVEPFENHLSDQGSLIRIAVTKDKDLAKSKYLERFLIKIENSGTREPFHEENQTNKSKFIVSEEEMDNDDDFEEEAEGLFDSVCALCDNGGDVLPCEGRCIRSFHPTIEAGADTCCESLGFADAAQYEAIPTFLCNNCKYHQHQCFICGILGSSDKSSPEVFPCVSATCGHFYHPKCLAQYSHSSDETQLQQVTAGESFTCPIHKCYSCKQGENKEVHELQFAVCRRCPKAYHRKCLPRNIAFEGSADGSVVQRAWDNLLPKRILIYCMDHKIIPSLGTPKRNHILFPYVERKQEGNKIKKVMSEKMSKALGNLTESNSKKMPIVVERRYKTVTYGDATMEKGKSSTMYEKKSSFKDMSVGRNLGQPSTMIKSKPVNRGMHREQTFTSKPVRKTAEITPHSADPDMEQRILKLMKDSTSSFNYEKFMEEQKRRCTREIYSPQTGLDKAITTGKVEASVKAVRAAVKKLEDGCSVEDAKAVCEPDILNQLIRWKRKLQIYLAPVLHSARYTSFGRHFTKVDKLKEIVNRLHWYMEDGDTLVDFCCGSNDFSCFMKEKLDHTRKRCSFKNYDLITPKRSFSFERKDWFSVPVEALPDGSRLVMGLNPPFGVQASLANKFIDHALKFRPKLLILIVPKETKRLDQKRSPYDLIWEEEQMLSGKSFYLPGSVDSHDQPLEDWNLIPPPLSLWSRPDWTAKHKAIAEKQSHIKPEQIKGAERVVSNYLMEDNHDCYSDFSNIVTGHHNIATILDDVPEEPDSSQPLEPTTNSSDAQKSKIHTQDTIDGRPFIQPTSHLGQYNGQHQYATVPYGAGIGFNQPSEIAYPGEGYIHPPSSTSPFGQDAFAMPPYASYGQPSYPSGLITPNGTNFIHSQHDFTSEPNTWPPGTRLPDSRYR